MSNDDPPMKKKKRSGKKSGKIFFDQEIVPKGPSHATTTTEERSQKEVTNNSNLIQTKNKTKKEKITYNQESVIDKKNDSNLRNKSEKHKESFKKQKQKNKSEAALGRKQEEDVPHEENEQSELDPANPTIEKEESKRAMKRKKHQQLCLQKKLKVDVVMQEKALNYLSRWKHSKNEWKFEKLRQIWLQQNMFDGDRVPEKFWDTLLEYFSNAQGKIRQVIIDNAVKIIESETDKSAQQNEENENTSEEVEDDESKNYLTKVHRAKSIIQSLQE